MIEKYVCEIYTKPKLDSVNDARLEMFLDKYKPTGEKLISCVKKMDATLLSPCSSVVKEKIKRTFAVFGTMQQSHTHQCLMQRSVVGNLRTAATESSGSRETCLLPSFVRLLMTKETNPAQLMEMMTAVIMKMKSWMKVT